MILRFLFISTLFFAEIFCYDHSLTEKLQESIYTDNIHNVELVLKNGANVNAPARDGGVPLHIAVGRGHEDIVELLLKYGADVNAFYKYGDRALTRAIRQHSKNIIELLLKYGTNINAPDKYGDTYLMVATREGLRGHPDIVELLLKYGASVNAANKDGWTALYYACSHVYSDDCEDAIRVLVKYGANVNAATTAGRTPLMEAARKENKNIVELLLKHGANINAVDKDGLSALSYATHYGYLYATRFMPDPDVDVRLKANRDIVDLLLNHGANVNATDKQRLKEHYDKVEILGLSE